MLADLGADKAELNTLPTPADDLTWPDLGTDKKYTIRRYLYRSLRWGDIALQPAPAVSPIVELP